MLENHLKDLKQLPRWVDGSGLSRYNLFSPESMVYVLSAMYSEFPKERLLNLFAEGGESGTLTDWYPGIPNPYIYAKTGSLGNNHNISGYLITKSGKTLIFSFMNNHFTIPASQIKKQMQLVFEWIRDNN
jgi:D-alanyl-D-alanine carboxypeptidase/D-alanyl-D-alanine-endopeptidase (penicillin-binding protein 4)